MAQCFMVSFRVRFRVRNRVRVRIGVRDRVRDRVTVRVRLFSPLRHLHCAEYRKPVDANARLCETSFRQIN